MPAAVLNVIREIEETFPHLVRATVTSEQALALGYDDLEEMAAALDGVTVRLSTSGAVAATVDATIRLGTDTHGDLTFLMSFQLPPSVTDAAQTLAYVVVFEPGSETSERVLCQGSLAIRPRPTA